MKAKTETATSAISKRIAGLLLHFVALAASAAETKPDVTFSWPSDGDVIVDLDPGQSIQRTLLISNEGTSESTSFPVEFSQPFYQAGRLGIDYHFETLTPDVCSTTQLDQNGARMTISALPASTQARCTFSIRRDEDSLHDVTLGSDDACFWSAQFRRCNRLLLQIGSHPDLSLRISPVAPVFIGDTEALLRVTVTNASDIAIAHPGFGGCFVDNLPRFAWDTDLVGGCGDQYAPMCSHVTVGFSAPDVPARGQSSCLIRLRFPPLQTSNTSGLGLDHELYSVGDDRFLLDTNLANSNGVFGVTPQLREPAVVPLHPAALATLLLLVLLSSGVLIKVTPKPEP